MPATLDDVARFALALPEVTEGERHGNRTWYVPDKRKPKVFVWERPLTKADIKRFGAETPPDGEIVALRTEDLHEKEAILATKTPGFFTMEHFNGFPAYLIQLHKVGKRALKVAIVDAWLVHATPALAEAYLKRRPLR